MWEHGTDSRVWVFPEIDEYPRRALAEDGDGDGDRWRWPALGGK
ncbi:hypothetical protein AB0D88_29165 [Streptomyces werraensis]